MDIKRMIAAGVLGKSISFPLILDLSNGVVPSFIKGASPWVGSTGKIIPTGLYSSEKLIDPGFEAWTGDTALTNYTHDTTGGNSVNKDTDKHSGDFSARYESVNDYTANAINGAMSENILANEWVKLSVWAKRTVAAAHNFYFKTINGSLGVASGSYAVKGLTTSFLQYIDTLFSHAVANRATISVAYNSTGSAGIYDDFSVTKLPLANSIAYLDKQVSKPWIRIRTVQPTVFYPWVGIIMNMDNPTNPQNFVMVVFNGSQATKLYKCVNGTTSLLVTTNTNNPYRNGKAIIELGWTSPTTVNYTCVGVSGTETTISDASILSGKYCGIVCSDNTAGISKFSVFTSQLGQILAIGNSITNAAGTDEVWGQGWNCALTDLLGAYSTIPEKIATGGYTVAETKAYIDAQLATRNGTPTHVIISHGANDIDTGLPDESTYKNNVAYILDAIHAKYPGAKVYWCTEFRTGREARTITLHGWNQSVIEDGRSAWAFIGVNANSVFSGHPELMSDSVHPNYAGYVAYATAMKTMLAL